MPVRAADGGDAVLKVQFPDREGRHEAHALALWNGDGAVRLLEHDPVRSALLIERCRPGTPLADLELDAALDVAWPAAPSSVGAGGAAVHDAATDEAQQWSVALQVDWEATGRPFARSLLDAALDAIASATLSLTKKGLGLSLQLIQPNASPSSATHTINRRPSASR